MIPIPIPILAYKWIAIALAMLAIIAWGGVGWSGKRAAQLEFADYKLAQARVVADQLAENQRLSDAQSRRGAEISEAYQKGKIDVAKAFQPARAELRLLRARYSGGAAGGMQQPADDGAGAMPSPTDPARRPHAVACTDRPGDLIDAARGVAAEIEGCAGKIRQLAALQAWVRGLAAKPHFTIREK